MQLQNVGMERCYRRNRLQSQIPKISDDLRPFQQQRSQDQIDFDHVTFEIP